MRRLSSIAVGAAFTASALAYLHYTVPDPDQRVCVVKDATAREGQFWACYVAGDSAIPSTKIVYSGPASGINRAYDHWRHPDADRVSCVVQRDEAGTFWGCYGPDDTARPSTKIVYSGPASGVGEAYGDWLSERTGKPVGYEKFRDVNGHTNCWIKVGDTSLIWCADGYRTES